MCVLFWYVVEHCEQWQRQRKTMNPNYVYFDMNNAQTNKFLCVRTPTPHEAELTEKQK